MDLWLCGLYGGFLMERMGRVKIVGTLTASAPGLHGIGAHTLGEVEVGRVKPISQGWLISSH